MSPVFTAIAPTVFLRRTGAGLEQRITVSLRNPLVTPQAVLLAVDGARHNLPPLPPGESAHDCFIPAIESPRDLTFELFLDGQRIDSRRVPWQPPRRWTVHVVQLSHHDAGYTDLASRVIPEHDRWLDATLELVAATRDFPEEARFRAVIEQTWSIDHFLRHAPPARAAAMLDGLRRGDLELTALFGNLTTELCGHEVLIRSLYPAFRLKRDYGLPLVSAEHNDIPGFSWGLCEALTGAGIRLFCPGLANYYSWGSSGAPSFWDEATIFGAAGMPGAFWWKSPSGKRILFWCNNAGCGGPCDPRLPGLAERLLQLQDGGYPYTVLRWPVLGGARDNSPYIDGYTHTVRDWNARWAFPRLICSTNARFYADLLPQLPVTLPVLGGEVPGQDYPVGAASTAAATAINRRNHADIPAAEALSVAAAHLTDRSDPTDQSDELAAAYEETLWHDEHSWGHHFPAGPSACAAELEKAVHAYRAAALTHDLTQKAMARIADAVRLDEPGLHLVVFNAMPIERAGLVRAPLRELDNCGSTMRPTEEGTLCGVLLGTRWHVNPPPEIVSGQFDLIDADTGEAVPFQIDALESPFDPHPYAAQRLGLAAGGKRLGLFENPSGIARDLLFHAKGVPALGYRTYRLEPRPDRPAFAVQVTASPPALENAFYRLELDPTTGFARSLFDKEIGRELIDPAAEHPFGAILARAPSGPLETTALTRLRAGPDGPVASSLRAAFTVKGHPHVEVTYTLNAAEKRLELAVAMLQDPTPLLETYVSFPFLLPQGRFRYEGPLCVVDPAHELMPGAYADRLTVQNWVAVSDGALSVLWSSHDAPVVSLARLWPGRVSPAHSAVIRADLVHPRQTPEDLLGAALYSLLTANNFGTNFCVSQSGALLFRYSLTSRAGDVPHADAARWGAGVQTPFGTIYTRDPGPRSLPPTGGFLFLDNPAIRLVALKRAEDGNGLIVRLWNPGRQQAQARIALPHLKTAAARLANLVEDDAGALGMEANSVTVPLDPGSVATVRLILST